MALDASAATAKAKEYLREVAGFQYLRVKSCVREHSKWILIVDVGLLVTNFKKVTVNAEDGSIEGLVEANGAN